MGAVRALGCLLLLGGAMPLVASASQDVWSVTGHPVLQTSTIRPQCNELIESSRSLHQDLRSASSVGTTGRRLQLASVPAALAPLAIDQTLRPDTFGQTSLQVELLGAIDPGGFVAWSLTSAAPSSSMLEVMSDASTSLMVDPAPCGVVGVADTVSLGLRVNALGATGRFGARIDLHSSRVTPSEAASLVASGCGDWRNGTLATPHQSVTIPPVTSPPGARYQLLPNASTTINILSTLVALCPNRVTITLGPNEETTASLEVTNLRSGRPVGFRWFRFDRRFRTEDEAMKMMVDLLRLPRGDWSNATALWEHRARHDTALAFERAVLSLNAQASPTWIGVSHGTSLASPFADAVRNATVSLALLEASLPRALETVALPPGSSLGTTIQAPAFSIGTTSTLAAGSTATEFLRVRYSQATPGARVAAGVNQRDARKASLTSTLVLLLDWGEARILPAELFPVIGSVAPHRSPLRHVALADPDVVQGACGQALLEAEAARMGVQSAQLLSLAHAPRGFAVDGASGGSNADEVEIVGPATLSSSTVIPGGSRRALPVGVVELRDAFGVPHRCGADVIRLSLRIISAPAAAVAAAAAGGPANGGQLEATVAGAGRFVVWLLPGSNGTFAVSSPLTSPSVLRVRVLSPTCCRGGLALGPDGLGCHCDRGYGVSQDVAPASDAHTWLPLPASLNALSSRTSRTNIMASSSASVLAETQCLAVAGAAASLGVAHGLQAVANGTRLDSGFPSVRDVESALANLTHSVALESLTSCTPCTEGSHRDSVGLSQCERCAVFTFGAGGSAACQSCPPPFVSEAGARCQDGRLRVRSTGVWWEDPHSVEAVVAASTGSAAFHLCPVPEVCQRVVVCALGLESVDLPPSALTELESTGVMVQMVETALRDAVSPVLLLSPNALRNVVGTTAAEECGSSPLQMLDAAIAALGNRSDERRAVLQAWRDASSLDVPASQGNGRGVLVQGRQLQVAIPPSVLVEEAARGATVRRRQHVQCGEGHSGPLCAVCDPGYAVSGFGQCSKCYDEPWQNWLMLVGIGVALVVFVVYWISRRVQRTRTRTTASGAQRILLSFLQVVSLVTELRTRTPRAIAGVGQAASTAGDGLSLDLYPVHCTLGLPFYTKVYVYAASPILSFIIVGIAIFGVGYPLYRGKTRTNIHSKDTTSTNQCRRWTDLWMASSVVLVFLLYSRVFRSLIDTFVVYPYPLQGSLRLQADVSVLANTPQHLASQVIAAIALLIYAVGIPSTFILLLCRNRHRLYPPSDEEVARLESQGLMTPEKREWVSESHSFFMRFSFTYDGARDGLFWWEAVVLTRKLAVSLAAALIPGAVMQSFAVSIVLVAALVLHLLVKPYALYGLNALEAVSLSSCLVLLVGSMLYWRLDQDLAGGIISDQTFSSWETVLTVILLLVLVLAVLVMVFAMMGGTGVKVLLRCCRASQLEASLDAVDSCCRHRSLPKRKHGAAVASATKKSVEEVTASLKRKKHSLRPRLVGEELQPPSGETLSRTTSSEPLVRKTSAVFMTSPLLTAKGSSAKLSTAPAPSGMANLSQFNARAGRNPRGVR
jgi:hypothetical protein